MVHPNSISALFLFFFCTLAMPKIKHRFYLCKANVLPLSHIPADINKQIFGWELVVVTINDIRDHPGGGCAELGMNPRSPTCQACALACPALSWPHLHPENS